MIKNILLAEDDRGTALLVKTQLESKGYKVQTAGNGIEALRILSSHAIDLIITDVIMPNMDGVDLYGAVKKDPKFTNIPIIIVTDKAIFKESFASLGVANFVEKTTDISKLLEKITHIEQEANEIKRYRKVLISSTHAVVINQMRTALHGMKYLVCAANNSSEILSNALMMVPHILVLDVLFEDNASSHEIIRSLRAFNVLKNMKIVTYAFFPEDLGINVDAVQSVEIAMKLCKEAGADEYIGRFNQSFFLERLSGGL